MKRKIIILAVVAAAAMAITLSHPCTVHKADRYKLCSVHRRLMMLMTTINFCLMRESKFKRGKQKTGK